MKVVTRIYWFCNWIVAFVPERANNVWVIDNKTRIEDDWLLFSNGNQKNVDPSKGSDFYGVWQLGLEYE